MSSSKYQWLKINQLMGCYEKTSIFLNYNIFVNKQVNDEIIFNKRKIEKALEKNKSINFILVRILIFQCFPIWFYTVSR